MGQSGIKEATVAIFGLRDVEDRSRSINPTSVSGNISVVLDVQPNDETVTGIALMLGDETIQCRGTSADADPIAGLAASGGQIEVDCFLDTDAVSGECVGMQLDPTYANGEYALGAFLTTDEGQTRSVVATQAITLKNSGFVMIAHEAGAMSVVSDATKGLTFYGGPPGEDGENVNSFHACPVSYKGTMVGEVQLGTLLTNTATPPVEVEEGAKVSFRRANGAPHYPIDDEAPFTWPISTAWWTGNGSVENMPGETEHWVEVIGLVKNADGLDVTGEFRDGDGELAKKGPFHFDYRAPRINQDDGTSAIVVSGPFSPTGSRANRSITDGNYFSDNSRTTPRLVVSYVVEEGVGDYEETIAVGDCSVAANTDNAARDTDFVALYDDVRNISELPEDDSESELSDDGGVDCYVAELQALEDAIGNSTWLGGSTERVQSGGEFGVDRTPPETSRLNPDEEVVLSADAVTFEAEDPALETGEDGSGLAIVIGQRYRSGRYRSEVVSASFSEEDVTADVSGLDEGSHAVRVLAGDNAFPRNYGVAYFDFTRDTKAPSFTAGSGPGAVSAGSSDRVTVTVSGSIRDANVIDEALLEVWNNMGVSDAICGPDDSTSDAAASPPVIGDSKLASSRVGTKDLENDTKRIDFEESVTIKRAAGGSENLCFVIRVKDVAVDADGDDDGANEAYYSTSNFTVNWGLGIAVSEDELTVPEGDATGVTYDVELQAQPSADVVVTPKASNTHVAVSPATLTFTTTNWNVAQTVTVSQAAHDDDAVNETAKISHTAAGGGYNNVTAAMVDVTVADDDATLAVDVSSIDEGVIDTVTVTVEFATAVTSDTDVTVTLTDNVPDSGTDDEQPVINKVGPGDNVTATDRTITVTTGKTKGTIELEIEVGNLAGQRDRRITVVAQHGDQGTNQVTDPADVDITLVNDDQ